MDKYSVNWENDEVVSVEVDGIQYASPEEIPDPEDRATIEDLISERRDDDFQAEFDKDWENFDKKFAERQKSTGGFPTLFFSIFLVAALVLLAIAVLTAIFTARSLATEKSAAGEVIDLVPIADQNGQTLYHPVVAFSLPDESQQVVQLNEGSTAPAYTRGQQVTILYDPAQPRSARIRSSAGSVFQWFVSLITGLLGVIFLAVALVVGWSARRKPAAAP